MFVERRKKAKGEKTEEIYNYFLGKRHKEAKEYTRKKVHRLIAKQTIEIYRRRFKPIGEICILLVSSCDRRKICTFHKEKKEELLLLPKKKES